MVDIKTLSFPIDDLLPQEGISTLLYQKCLISFLTPCCRHTGILSSKEANHFPLGT